MRFRKSELELDTYTYCDFWLCSLILNSKFTDVPRRLIKPSKWRLMNCVNPYDYDSNELVKVNKLNDLDLTGKSINIDKLDDFTVYVFGNELECKNKFNELINECESNLSKHLDKLELTRIKLNELKSK